MAKKYPNLKNVLKKLLFERDMKPIDLARELHIPQPTIHRLVTGKSSRPYESSLKPIADFFAVTVDQLLGEATLPDAILQNEMVKAPANSHVIKTIPIISWKQLDTLTEACKTTTKQVVTIGNLSVESFALVMADSSMEPFFARGTLLIMDPQQAAKDRSYVVVKLKENPVYLFRQLLIDGEDRYLKPLNPDLSMFKMRLLNEGDTIIGCLVESRNQYLPEDQVKLLEDI